MTKLIGLFYFSGTSVTESLSFYIKKELESYNFKCELQDVTSFKKRQRDYAFNDYDAVIFGFPVYSDFAPSVINDWISSINGKDTKCAMFFTYGARTSGYAHFHTKLLLEKSGFKVLFSAEFLGRHTFNVGGWDVLPNRPDDSDFVVAKEYANIFKDKIDSNYNNFLQLQKPFGYNNAIAALEDKQGEVKKGIFHPFRDAESCSMCRVCEINCPTQAFSAKIGEADPSKCIKCMKCLDNCNDKVLKIDEKVKSVAYNGFLSGWCLTEDIMNKKTSKLILHPSDAAQ